MRHLHDRPREYEELVKSGELKKLEVAAPPRWLRIAGRVFGFTALAFGLTLIGLIIWSMVFQYWLGPSRKTELFRRMPSIRNRFRKLVKPRMYGEPWPCAVF